MLYRYLRKFATGRGRFGRYYLMAPALVCAATSFARIGRCDEAVPAEPVPQYYKGNIHTHS
ncbi:MAG: hypothetical protein MUQ52_10870, partial [Pirellulales bacterium]|nr:hypothetical protein [Pirellulales bacterium]